MKASKPDKVEIWGGIECTINRVNDEYFDQLSYSGHYDRPDDTALFTRLGIKKIRYPVLWEKHQPQKDMPIDWLHTEQRLNDLKLNGIEIIAGLVHHGSGPMYVNMMDGSFADGLAEYARQVALKFPWIEYYTPVNEPLTTARFCGLYGIWYPHQHCDESFCRILINECKGTILAMREIRRINPNAKLIQTDDLGKIHSTPLLRSQADFENERRWLAYDLLCGKVTPVHPLWQYLTNSGISKDELDFFVQNKCEPDIIGLNHYLTSERYLDENLEAYPTHTHGGNGRHNYADVEAVRVGWVCPDGPLKLIKEAWGRYHLPMAITEVHLFCTREEQMRWLSIMWNAVRQLREENIIVLAITPWAMFGSFGWDHLLTQPNGQYESGLFDLSGGSPRATVLAKMVEAYSNNEQFSHPVLGIKGWWQRKCRVIYGTESFYHDNEDQQNIRPVLIIDKTEDLGKAYARICELRGIACHILGENDNIEKTIAKIDPWAIINTCGLTRIEEYERNLSGCFTTNTYNQIQLALVCRKHDIKLLTFSSGSETLNYNPDALVIRTIDPLGKPGFISVIIAETHIWDMVNNSLNLLLDDERGIWHLNNNGHTSRIHISKEISKRLTPIQLTDHNGRLSA